MSDALLWLGAMPPWVASLLGAALATLGFAVAVNVPRRCLAFAVLVGVAGQGAYRVALAQGYAPEAAAFLGGVAVGALAEIGARRYHTPVTVFTITGFIPLVPGSLAFRAIATWLDDQFLLGLVFALRTFIIGGSIAAGLGLVSALMRMRGH